MGRHNNIKNNSEKIELFIIICLFILLVGFVLETPSALTPSLQQSQQHITAQQEIRITPNPPPPSLPASDTRPTEIVPFQFPHKKLKLDIFDWYVQTASVLPISPDIPTTTAPEPDTKVSTGTNTDVSLKSYTPPRYGETLKVSVVGAPSAPIYVHIYNATDPSASISRADAIFFFADILDALSASPLDASLLPISAILAQAYTEGGAGRYGVYRATNNLFGIRAGPAWHGPVYSRTTKKTYASYSLATSCAATNLFRAYPSIAASLDDYITLITTSPLYKKALSATSTPKKYLQRLTSAGYGDPAMVSTWMQVIKLYGLTHPEKILAQAQVQTQAYQEKKEH